MPLQINNLEYGLIPFGPGYGERGIIIDIGEISDITEESTLTTLFEKLKIKIKELDLEKQWLTAIDGTNSTFLLFKGNNGIEKEENQPEWDNFNRQLSKESVQIQMTLKLRPDQLKPPFCIWFGKPENFTGNRLFYEYFNCIYGIIENNFNPLATQEIVNHKFSAITLIANENYKSIVDDLNLKYKLNRKLYIIGKSEELQEYCMIKGYRYNYTLENKTFLKLI